jgi:hypothetical protein
MDWIGAISQLVVVQRYLISPYRFGTTMNYSDNSRDGEFNEEGCNRAGADCGSAGIPYGYGDDGSDLSESDGVRAH